jgi:anti-sigma factor RsiW
MNQEMQLKLQACLDGELSGREARKVAAWMTADPEAQALAQELRLTRQALRENEPQHILPEPGEFYWSKIEREVLKAEPVSMSGLALAWWALRRYLAPVAGVAIVAFLAVAIIRFSGPIPANQHLAEVEDLSEHVGSFSFRSQMGNMVVVWLYDKSQSLSAEPDAFEEEMTFQ